MPSISMARVMDPTLNQAAPIRAAKAPLPQTDKKKAAATAKAKAKAAKAVKEKKKTAPKAKAAKATKENKEAKVNAAKALKAKKKAEAKAAKATKKKKDAEAKAKAKAANAKKKAAPKAKAERTAKAKAKAANAKKKAAPKAKAERTTKAKREVEAKRKADELKEESKIDSDGFINRLKNSLFSLGKFKNFKLSSAKDIVVRKVNSDLGSYTRALYEVIVSGKNFITKLLTPTREDGKDKYTERNNLRKLEPQFKDYDKDRTHNPLLPKLGRYFADTEFNANGQSFHFILLEKREGIPLWKLAGDVCMKLAKAQLPSQREMGWFTKIGQSLASFHLKYKTQNSNRLETLIHGDLHFGNLLFDPTREDVSLIDYETMKIGDPIEDTDRLFIHNNGNVLQHVGSEAEEVFKSINVEPFNLSDIEVEHLWDKFDHTILPNIINQYDECFNEIARGYNSILHNMGLGHYSVALPYP